MEKAIKIEELTNANKSKSTRAGWLETFYSIGRVVHERNASDMRLKTCVWYMLVCGMWSVWSTRKRMVSAHSARPSLNL
jgi:hypothetical protein